MLLASFVAGLSGVAGRQVRYQNPQTLQRALFIALLVTEAEKQERVSETFYAKFDESVSFKPQSTSRSDREGIALGAQLTHAQVITRSVSSTGLHTAPISQ
jgi:hypothetical protein